MYIINSKEKCPYIVITVNSEWLNIKRSGMLFGIVNKNRQKKSSLISYIYILKKKNPSFLDVPFNLQRRMSNFTLRFFILSSVCSH